jgi:lipooligosaccharide transport system ATP-binding protein
MTPPMLTACRLRKCYDAFCAVDAIDFSLAAGTCLGILGPNGAGKTTTIQMIYGAIDPTDGELHIFDQPFHAHRRAIKSRIGVVMQRDIHEEALTAYENLLIHGRFYGLSAPMITQRSRHLLQQFQLAERADVPVFQWSGGMKRRLSLAKGMLSQPDLLLLDEPTTGLDPQARHLLWREIRAIQSHGTAILLTTHYMHEAEALCDDIVILDHGAIIATGSPSALIAQHACANLEEVFLHLTGRDLRE